MTRPRPLAAFMGELLMDFFAVETGTDVGHARTFVKAPGGAVANTAVAFARLGGAARFVGKVGSDPFGRFLVEHLQAEGIDVSRLLVSQEYETALVFVALNDHKVPSFSFFGNPSADMMLREDEVGPEALADAAFLHLGTVSMVREPVRSATFKLLGLARDAGLRVSFDPNLRLHLWRDHDELRRLTLGALAQADLVKLNLDEVAFLTGERSPERGAQKLLDLGPRAVVVTLGPEGAYFARPLGKGREPGFEVEVVDTTGAGDAFAAGLLAQLVGRDWPPDLEELRRAVRFANAVGALAATAVGAVSALPTMEQARSLISSSGREP